MDEDQDDEDVEMEHRRNASTSESNSKGICIVNVENIDLSPIRIEELVISQADDSYCQMLKEKVDNDETSRFDVDDRGLLVRIAPLDDCRQIVVPTTLRQKILYLCHYTRTSGHPGGTKMFYTTRRTFYWPSMALECHACVRQCDSCARERVQLRKHSTFLKLFPARRPLEFVAIDILGPLPRSTKGNQYLLVISDRFSKMTRAIPLKSITSMTVARAFVENWIYPYGPPAYLLSDNSGQFASKFFQKICQIMGIRNLFTTAYHPQTNGQVERFNRTILSGIRHYVVEHQRKWDEYCGPLTYAYNTQVHRSTGCTPFELVLSRPPGPVALENIPASGTMPETRDERMGLMDHLKRLMQGATETLKAAQARYKENYDKHVRTVAFPADVGDKVFIKREVPLRAETGGISRNKLQPKADGPFEVIGATSHTVTIIRDGLTETVTRDRISKKAVPVPAIIAREVEDDNGAEDEPLDQPAASSEAPAHGETRDNSNDEWSGRTPSEEISQDLRRPFSRLRRFEIPETEYAVDGRRKEHSFDAIVDYNDRNDRFRVRWTGYDESGDTWEPGRNLPFNAVVRYFRRRGRHVPEHLRHLLATTH